MKPEFQYFVKLTIAHGIFGIHTVPLSVTAPDAAAAIREAKDVAQGMACDVRDIISAIRGEEIHCGEKPGAGKRTA